jgi:hypothetical protein
VIRALIKIIDVFLGGYTLLDIFIEIFYDIAASSWGYKIQEENRFLFEAVFSDHSLYPIRTENPENFWCLTKDQSLS